MIKNLFLAVLLLFSSFAFAQNNTLKGKVTDNFNVPLIGVNVVVKNTINGSQTDLDGNFTIDKVSNGNHVLVVSYLGFKTREIPFLVSGSESKELGAIILFEGSELLQEIVISSDRKNKFSRKQTAYVSKLPLKDMLNAQVYSTVTNELLESQIVTNFDDAMVNATGISKLWESTGRAPGEGTGYFAARGFATQPQLVNGMPGFTFSAVDPSYIERIEVIKGPAATLFGSTVTSLGGLINVVTKKPFEGFGGSVSYTAGSFDMHRFSADVNTPLGKSEDVYFRINASYLTQNSFQDAGFRKTFFVAPSLSYRVNNRLNLSLGLEYSNTKQTNPSMLFVRRGMPMVSRNVHDLGVNPNKSFTSDNVSLTSPIVNTRAIADYKISDQWTSQTVFASTHSKSDGYYQYMIEGAAVAFGLFQQLADIPYPPLQASVNEILVESGSLLQQDAFTRIYDKRDAKGNKYNIQQNFTGDFKLGSMRNRLILGLDYVQRDTESNNKNGNPSLAGNSNFPFIIQTLNVLQAGQGDVVAAQLGGLPYFDGFFKANGDIVPTTFTPNAKYSVTKADLDAIFDQIAARKVETSSKTFAAYVSDVLNITDNLTVNVGLRMDYFDQDGDKNDTLDDYDKTTFSPNAGVVYQVLPKKLSLFTNYQTGFINNDPVVNSDGSVETFEPTKAKQFEGGFKSNFFNGKLNIGVSYYYITVENSLNSDPRAPLFPRRIMLGETESKGIEIELNASPVNGLNLRASYSYNDSEITDAYSEKDNVTYAELQGRRPEEAGPESIYNFWADYKFSKESALKNFGIGAGFNGASKHLMMNNAVSGEFTLPAYTIYNATVYYDADKFRIGFKVNNFTDETYYKGWSTVNAQAPRAIVGTVSYKF
ncbi:TonB-dependent siderophore receptor [Marinifilum breve]|uniref:TonB-dependent siderophore receptor n=1 Tax=Marinifilum breve TaxID=2184082 RepID=A0A2V3ZUV4_9BACT|nr:TonB-dependent receptor [Marinifilum breve]PXX98069.1 TonB-dependent siderophore receptor [Marinifilum breve]